MWQLELDLKLTGFLSSPFLDVKKLAARIVGSKSFEETAPKLAPDCVAKPRHGGSPMRVGLLGSLPPAPSLRLTGDT